MDMPVVAESEFTFQQLLFRNAYVQLQSRVSGHFPREGHSVTSTLLHMHFKDTNSSNLTPGPSCSILTTSLVNVSLKFQTLILQIHCYFLLKKCESLTFFQQKITVYLLLLLIFA